MSSPITPTPAIEKVSVEVWLNICEELLGADGYGDRILPLLQVCRKWRDVFTPALHRHLSVGDPVTLERIYVRLASSDLAGKPVGQWCQSLVVDPARLGSDLHPSYATLPLLLSYLPNLRVFSTISSIRASDLDALTRTCKDSLRSLSVSISGRGSLGGLGLGFISRLTRLNYLSISVHWGGDSSLFSVESAPGFNMPSLKFLSWSAIDQPIQPYLSFLSRCQFPALDRLELGLPALRSQSVPFVTPFLELNSTRITRLDILQPPPSPTLGALLQFTRPEHLTFSPQPPSPSIVYDIPLSVRHLHLSLDRSGSGSDGFCTLLETMCTTDARLGLTDISVHGSGFLWTDLHRIPADFAVRLVRFALRLAERGILMLDEQGKAIQISRPVSAR